MDSSPTLPAVQPMILTPDEQAVVLAIRRIRETLKPGMLVLRVEPGEPGRPSGIMINACTGTQYVKRKAVT